ncbi:LOW QUALITY PROTEIN: methyltransferase-like protein 25 isoform X1 [Cricetulus griseus]|uniref:LOW QUALITY PROTEIN: methyltransferase-like protein 25 isoform X1 n=1 Tax=Cricetulus griseus TaxID=10029 RepID=UPI0015C3DAA6|nr:LOW QUALITY PROTEIN: methyltransferase-like protein 25 isoform X1 [Cricetulus griseus]
MNTKKSHEVQEMSELICFIADYCGLKQIIDVGSGKGYLSSFLSLKYGLNVYGINSSNTNTHGAKERNRKLKKHWNLNHCQTIVDVNRLALKMPKEIGAQKEIKCKGEFESVPKSSLGNQDVSSNVLPEFSESAVSAIRKQLGDLHALPLEEEKLYFENTFSLMDFLPIDAIEPTHSSQVHNSEMSEVRKQRRNMATKPSDSSIYSPLTSFITADSELHDIIQDLELSLLLNPLDCLMVGLHTCGDLAPNTLRIFASKSEVKGVCSVGCCYHLLSEEFENQTKGKYVQENWGFPMCCYLKEERLCCGHNARTSACLALEWVAVGQELPTKSLFCHAVLQNIIKDYYGNTKCDQHVGKIYSKCSSFLDYVRRSLKKLGLDEAKVSLNVVLAPCIETLILLDRLCYLKEQEDVVWSALVKLFDPVNCPRCYAVVALKKQW